ncbi:unnamed protein product [Mytilus coruscus]|uniref:Uncharacterized protein n=1 Tax=Mytilus coruscus TaxID=42192 RepID=A0A6J8D6M3_MYTCO|nr:unnamed protein product [Mytilus coruscus]
MSKRGAEPTTSSAHIAFKQTKGKKECPGCNQWFGNRHFENHKTKYFRHGNWRCKTSDPQECEVEEDVVLSTNSNEQSEDEDEEFWHNLTLADIDEDFNGQDESANDTHYLNNFSHDAINDDNLKKNNFLFICHGATLGCSKCYKTFPGDVGHKCYGGFDVNEWPSRNLLEHRHNMNVVKSARTQTERDRFESQFGIRSFEQLYGTDKVTPNMHLHCHLASCVRILDQCIPFGHLVLKENFQNYLEKFLGLNRCTEIGIEVTDQEIRNLFIFVKEKCSIPNQDWSHILAYKFSKVSTHCLTAEEYRVLKHTYKTIYPDLAHMVLPESCRKCSFVTLRNEVYGSWESRHKRSSFIMAYWNAGDGKNCGRCWYRDLLPGIVQTYYLHNLIVENESKVHLFAKVNWLAPLPDCYRYHCGKPVEVWSRDIYDVFGLSAFIPVQKIYCKYVRADGKLSEKLVSYICPLNSGMNI